MQNIGKILLATVRHRQSVGDVKEQRECLHFLELLQKNPFREPKKPRPDAHKRKTSQAV